MNIRHAKRQIPNAMKVYFTKDSFGNRILRIEWRRPIFNIDSLGIRKTCIIVGGIGVVL